MHPKTDPAVKFTDRNNEESNLIRTSFPPTQQIADVISLCQSFFKQEKTKEAIAMIKGNRIVQENAIEMRNAIESLYNSENKESKTHQEKIKALSQRLRDQMILANAAQKDKALESVLALVFESDKRSIEYLSTFHSVLGMALQHSKMFSERVNVDLKRTRLLKRALNEIVDEDNSRMQEFSDFSDNSQKRSRSANSPDPVNVFLGSSDDERTEPARKLKNITRRLSAEEEDVDIASNAMKTARHTLRQPVRNDYDSEFTERVHM